MRLVKNTYTRFLIATAFASLSLVGCVSPKSSSGLNPDRSNGRNVVLITVDGLGQGDISVNGAEYATPYIDQLASNGLTLNRFYTASQASGTLAGLMTARDPHELGISYAEFYPWSQGALAPSEYLLSNSLQDAGYETALIGKWHLGSHTQRHHPNSRGFDYFFGHLNGQVDYLEHTAARGKDIQENGVSIGDLHDGVFGPELISSAAVNWLSTIRNPGTRNPGSTGQPTPFFMHVAFKAPRAPLQAPDALIQQVRNDNPGLSGERLIYAAMVTAVDNGVGDIVAALQQQGVADNTLIVFMSTGGGDLANGATSGSLRGGKLSAYEGGVRNIAIMAGPGLPKGASTEQVLSVVDLYPTINAATGTANGAPMSKRQFQDGVSYWENLVNATVTPHAEIYIGAEGENGIGNDFNFAIIRGDYKVVRQVSRSYEGISIRNELYNLATDPAENIDLSTSNSELLNTLLSGFVDWRSQHIWTGNHLELAPLPGWVAPTDWALRMQQRESTVSPESGDNVFGFISGPSLRRLDNRLYQKTGVGTIVYQ